MKDGLRPGWAVVLQIQRERRAWNKPEMARRLYEVRGLAGTPAMIGSLVRQIRGWENGDHFPRDWIMAYAAAFGVGEDELFSGPDEEGFRAKRRDALKLGIAPSVTPDVAGRVLRDAALDAMEFTRRVGATAVGAATFGHLEAAVMQLDRAYTVEPPAGLFGLARGYRARVAEMASGSCTLRELRELYVFAGWLSEKLAWLSHDLGDPMAAEAWAVDSFAHAEEAGHAELCAWAMDAMASIAIYTGRSQKAVAAARAGMARVPLGHPLAVRLRAQAARAHARLGQREDCEGLLREAAGLYDRLPARAPMRFALDTGTLAGYAMTAYAASSYIWLGDAARGDFENARRHAQEAVAAHEGAPASDRSPSREAIARIDLGMALAALGEPDQAAALGREALASSRLVDSVRSRAGELDKLLIARHPGVAEVREFHEGYEAVSGRGAMGGSP